MSLDSASLSFGSGSDHVTTPRSPEKVCPRDLPSAKRVITSLHKDLIDLRKLNYQLEQRCVTAEHTNIQLKERVVALESANLTLSQRERSLQSSVEECSQLIERKI